MVWFSVILGLNVVEGCFLEFARLGCPGQGKTHGCARGLSCWMTFMLLRALVLGNP